MARDASGRARQPREQRAGATSSGPELPPDVDPAELDPVVRRELGTLPKGLAELVGKHLAAAGLVLDEDPERALEHARFARSRASRIGAVREGAGLAAYHVGEWGEALGELRAAQRLGAGRGQHAVMADCERALGRPERALQLAARNEQADLPTAEAVELRIVAAGARRDLGQFAAAVVALQGSDLDTATNEPWVTRLRYAHADNLLAAGRVADAAHWFLAAADADLAGETDADERAAELDGRAGAR